MINEINLINISTHNLKNIDVKIIKNKITAIYGRSGAGKSSLAFSTLYKLCSDEFEALENGYTENNEYQIESYSGIIPAVSVSQVSNNNNPRSTLYSYLNIAQTLSFLAKNDFLGIPDFKYLKINKPSNECQCCKGLGEIPVVDLESIIDYEKSISEKPFSIWRTGSFSGLYHNLLLEYCDFEKIKTDVPFKLLSNSEKKKILYENSSKRLSFKFKYKNVTKQRTAYYEGVMLAAQNFIGRKSLEIATAHEICPGCLGSRINVKNHEDVSLFDISFYNFLTYSFSDLLDILNTLPGVNELARIINSICDMGLGYLNFSRSIPSLSGGELQKLRFSRLLNSNISGVLIVIDEISSQINEKDFNKILNKIKYLSKNNTIVLVEHSQYFIDNADYKIHIGLGAGQKGGYICPDEKIVAVNKKSGKRKTKKFICFDNVSKNNVIRQNLKIPEGCLTVFTGPSGSGKSSIARVIEERENAIYISQKNASFNSRSVLAATIKINNLIAEYFSKNSDFPVSEFLLSKNAGCKTCDGIGLIKYERGYDKDFYSTCPACEGNLFNKENEAIDIKVNGLTVVDFYNKDIIELNSILYNIDSLLTTILKTMIALGLGYLQLNRKTQTLSGGELRRIKLCEHLARRRKTNKILIIDEPVAGLDPEAASKIAGFINEKVSLFNAIIIIEHRQEIIEFSDYEVKVGPFVGKLGGKVLSQDFTN